MRPGLLLVLTCVTALLAAHPLRAEDAAPSCDVPDNLLTTEATLPKVADALKAGKLDILVVGRRYSTLVSADSSVYTARRQAGLPIAALRSGGWPKCRLVLSGRPAPWMLFG